MNVVALGFGRRLCLVDELAQRGVLGPIGVVVVEEAKVTIERREFFEQRVRITVTVEIEEERAVLALPGHERPAERLARGLDPLLLKRVELAIAGSIGQLRP